MAFQVDLELTEQSEALPGCNNADTPNKGPEGSLVMKDAERKVERKTGNEVQKQSVVSLMLDYLT